MAAHLRPARDVVRVEHDEEVEQSGDDQEGVAVLIGDGGHDAGAETERPRRRSMAGPGRHWRTPRGRPAARSKSKGNKRPCSNSPIANSIGQARRERPRPSAAGPARNGPRRASPRPRRTAARACLARPRGVPARRWSISWPYRDHSLAGYASAPILSRRRPFTPAASRFGAQHADEHPAARRAERERRHGRSRRCRAARVLPTRARWWRRWAPRPRRSPCACGAACAARTIHAASAPAAPETYSPVQRAQTGIGRPPIMKRSLGPLMADERARGVGRPARDRQRLGVRMRERGKKNGRGPEDRGRGQEQRDPALHRAARLAWLSAPARRRPEWRGPPRRCSRCGSAA